MMVCDASMTILAEFGGIKVSQHLSLNFYLNFPTCKFSQKILTEEHLATSCLSKIGHSQWHCDTHTF